MDLSIIIISYNTKDLLFQCINSIPIALKDIPNLIYEVIIVDNDSIDGSVEMVRQTFPGVKIIQNSTNKGYAYAVNRGIEFASGEYLLLINSDIIFTENSIFPIIKYMENNARTGIAGPQLIYKNKDLQVSYEEINSLKKVLLEIIFINIIRKQIEKILIKFFSKKYKSIKSVGYICGAAMCIRRKLIEEIGYFDERFFFFAEDDDFCLRAHKAKWDVIFVPESRIIHDRGGSSKKKNPFFYMIQLEKSNLQFFAKHYCKTSFLFYKILLCFRTVESIVINWIRLIFYRIKMDKRKIIQQREKIKTFKEIINITFYWKP